MSSDTMPSLAPTAGAHTANQSANKVGNSHESQASQHQEFQEVTEVDGSFETFRDHFDQNIKTPLNKKVESDKNSSESMVMMGDFFILDQDNGLNIPLVLEGPETISAKVLNQQFFAFTKTDTQNAQNQIETSNVKQGPIDTKTFRIPEQLTIPDKDSGLLDGDDQQISTESDDGLWELLNDNQETEFVFESVEDIQLTQPNSQFLEPLPLQKSPEPSLNQLLSSFKSNIQDISEADNSNVSDDINPLFEPPVKQITDYIRNSEIGPDSRIQLALYPEGLGMVKITFQSRQDQITGVLEVENSQTRKDIEQALPEVLASIESAGVEVRRIEVIDYQTPESGQHFKNQSGDDFEPYLDRDFQSQHRQAPSAEKSIFDEDNHDMRDELPGLLSRMTIGPDSINALA